MIERIFRHYRARARLKARKARGAEIERDLRNSWTTVKSWRQGLVWTSGERKDQPAGFFLILGQLNALGERRIHIEHNDLRGCSEGSGEERLKQSEKYQEALLWFHGIDKDDGED